MADYEVELDAYVLPDGHKVYKLFPGETYRLNKEIVGSKAAFLDVRGLDTLNDDPASWTDDELRAVMKDDRIRREFAARRAVKRPAAQDNKRIKFLRNLFFVAKRGDLVVVPLGRGINGDVAIGEFSTEPGDIRRVTVMDGTAEFSTWGRPISWRTTTAKRSRFTVEMNSRLHAPAAFHLLEASFLEEVYLAAYGSFNYDNIYVASFPSDKERFTTTDQASIGVWFNGVSVIYQREVNGGSIGDEEGFIDLGLEESGVELELMHNSPLSVIMRTVGPLAFSALALYPMAVQGLPLSSLQNVSVSAKAVAGAVDKCNVIIPPELAQIARGSGHGRWLTNCRIGKRVKEGATVKPTGHLKTPPKKPK